MRRHLSYCCQEGDPADGTLLYGKNGGKEKEIVKALKEKKKKKIKNPSLLCSPGQAFNSFHGITQKFNILVQVTGI